MQDLPRGEDTAIARHVLARNRRAASPAVGNLRPDRYATPFTQKRPIVQMWANALSQSGLLV